MAGDALKLQFAFASRAASLLSARRTFSGEKIESSSVDCSCKRLVTLVAADRACGPTVYTRNFQGSRTMRLNVSRQIMPPCSPLGLADRLVSGELIGDDTRAADEASSLLCCGHSIADGGGCLRFALWCEPTTAIGF